MFVVFLIIGGRFHSLTEMTKTKKCYDQNGSDQNGQTETTKPNQPDQNVLFQ